MVQDIFGILLTELGKLLKIPKLEPDANHSCLIHFPDELSIQIEMDRTGSFLMLCADIGVVPPGRFREAVFKEALKSNGQLPPRVGDFSYSKQADKLVLTELLPIDNISGDKVFTHLTPFMEKAKTWKNAIAKGDVPSALQGSYTSSTSGGGMFGLK